MNHGRHLAVLLSGLAASCAALAGLDDEFVVGNPSAGGAAGGTASAVGASGAGGGGGTSSGTGAAATGTPTGTGGA
ncbi:MAG: hypothetical protein JRI23_02185, partial [Deltaproteobacteria bacterium]|nr:hypothetical protein [Deltaproteobacteria bacterium]MBW2530288.1 hypothetical protein [Deltaproteobacteria bacterium]